MKMSPVSILAAVLLTGCAHGKAESESARAERGEHHAARESGRDRQAAEGVAIERDREDMPRRKHARGRMASAGDELPVQEGEQPKNAEQFGSEPDNTRVNERDRESSALTPLDQSEQENDRELTARIRKSVIADDSLSFTAKNVKIITRDGLVTLRGAVNNERERTTIARLAQEAAGDVRIVNELEISDD